MFDKITSSKMGDIISIKIDNITIWQQQEEHKHSYTYNGCTGRCACGKTITSHNYTQTSDYQPTDGSNMLHECTMTCTKCSASYQGQSYHRYDSFVDNGDGTHSQRCSDCGYTKNVKIQHTFDNEADTQCNDCTFIRDNNAACTHTNTTKEEKDKTAATCTDDGSYTEVTTCIDCGEVISEEYKKIDALGHDWAYSSVDNFEHQEYCHQCNALNRVSHNFITTPATCYTDGTKYCPDCELDITLSAAHKAGEEIKENIKEATCTNKGSYDIVQYCTVCKTELYRTKVETDPLTHDWSELVGNPPRYQCSNCGAESPFPIL